MERTTPAAGERAGAGPDPGGDARLAPAFEALEDDAIRVLSLDVFDTLLWRKVPEPGDLFELLAARLRSAGLLAPEVTDAVFAQLRGAAERSARAARSARDGGVEVTLDEIHTALPASLFARPPAPGELAELECGVERASLVCDLDVLALVRAARDSGREVIAVSDTYFSERQLRQFLARGPLADAQPDRVFTSSAHGAGKASGLFTVVLEALGRRPQEVLHVGDNHHADVVAPQALGIRAVYFERRAPELQRVMERERLYSDGLHPVHGDHGLAALRAKTAARTEGARQAEGLAPFWRYGAIALGPAFAGFAEWVQSQAAAAGASRAYCLMREGELLSGLVNAAAGGVVAEPAWLSRQVCARAAITEGTREELEALFARRRLPTLREYLSTLGLSVDDLPALAEQADRRLDDAGFGDEVIDAILADSALRARVVAGSRDLRRRILRYVEGLRAPGEDVLVLVDLGWRATIQATLDSILRDAGHDVRTLGLYMLTSRQVSDRLLAGVDARGFLAQAGLPRRPVDDLMRSPEILEQVCMPDHGSQVGLTEDLQPVLAPGGDFSVQSVERAAVQQGIQAFQREWERYRAAVPGALGPLAGARGQLLAQVARAVTGPTADEAALFGGWLHDENFGSQDVERIAQAPAARALRYMEPRRLVKVPMTDMYWPFGLAALQDDQLAAAAQAVAAGAVGWEAFSSELETGAFDVTPDLGWGFLAPERKHVPVRRNRRGLSFARRTIRGDFVKRLRLEPAHAPCVLRIDWISLRCMVHGRPEPETVEIESPRDFSRLVKLRRCRELSPKLLMVPGDSPELIVDVEKAVGAPVWRLEFECAFAVLPVQRSQARERWARVKARLLRVAKESRLGAPLRLARRALGR